MTLPRPQRLEPDAIHVHSFIRPDDEIYFFHEYTARKGYGHSPGNDLISNLKKDVVRFRGNAAVMGHKRRAIDECARMITHGFRADWLASALLTPIPPSKALDDPAYDDRMLRVARAVRVLEEPPRLADAREIVRQVRSLRKSHESADGERPDVQELIDAYALVDDLPAPPAGIAILDDMLTTGRHFRAMHHILRPLYPEAHLIGIFIARRVPPEGVSFDQLFGE